jgi:hypothetical protein
MSKDMHFMKERKRCCASGTEYRTSWRTADRIYIVYMRIPATSADLRRWAMQCYDQTTDPRVSGDERENLLKNANVTSCARGRARLALWK